MNQQKTKRTLTRHSKQLGSNSSQTLNSIVYGKIPPQARELEQSVLGAIMIEKRAFDIVAEILKEESFYVESHKIIFRSFKNLIANNLPIDMLTVVEALKTTDELDAIGGILYISQLTNIVTGTAHLEAHARIVSQKYIQRELIKISSEIINEAYNDSTDVFDLFDKAESKFYEISTSNFKNDYLKLSDGMPSLINKIEYLRTQDEIVTGVPSNFSELDRVTHGWQPTDLIILAARPSVGKTAFALNLARNATTHATKPVAVGFFSLEMSAEQLLKRVVSMDSGIFMSKLSSGKIDNMNVLYQAMDKIDKLNIYVDDSAALNLFELRNKARRMVAKHKVGMIIIDYLQLMAGDRSNGGNREQEISSISRGLKGLAKELKVPIIALSQLSRLVENRGKGQKIPQLSDLRESGAIEQDADMVMFIYRPPEDEVLEDVELQNKAMLKIAKHRNGALESFAFLVNDSIQKWEEAGILGAKDWTPVRYDNKNNDLPGSAKKYYSKIENSSLNEDDMPF
jgi:replicative DNA helicase